MQMRSTADELKQIGRLDEHHGIGIARPQFVRRQVPQTLLLHGRRMFVMVVGVMVVRGMPEVQEVVDKVTVTLLSSASTWSPDHFLDCLCSHVSNQLKFWSPRLPRRVPGAGALWDTRSSITGNWCEAHANDVDTEGLWRANQRMLREN